MEPLNQAARSSAKNMFFGFYALSLLAVILATYFLFNTPAGIFKNKIRVYRATEEEQARLLSKIESMNANLKNIIQTDEKYLSSTNEFEKGSLLGNLQEYQKNINDGLVNLKNDSSLFSSTVSKKDSYNYISAFNAIVAYRNTITALQKTLEGKGGDATELLKVKSQLDLCSQQLEICKMLAAKPVAAAAPAGGGGGKSAKEAELQQMLDKSQADLAACQKAKAGTVVPVAVEPAGSNESKKAQVLFDAGQDLYTTAEKTKNLIERRGILSAAKQLLQKSANAYPDKDKLNKVINQIDVEIRKLSNMG
ncbi:MAG TPA: hypothetical protein VFC34_04165 [Puia sp.]|nr:hypothetical protein [Puia sp.]